MRNSNLSIISAKLCFRKISCTVWVQMRSFRRLCEVETPTLLSRLFFPKWFPYNPARYTAVDTAGCGRRLSMDRKQSGFTLIEILVVVAIIATLAGLVALLIPKAQFEQNKIGCISNCSNLSKLLQLAGKSNYPAYSGANLLLYFVKRSDIEGKDNLQVYFCPGDTNAWQRSGGPEAFKPSNIDLRKHDYDDLTSYAGRRQLDKQCAAKRGATGTFVLMADQDEGHHDKRGICVGLTGGGAKYRDKYDDYEMDPETVLDIGESSAIEELKCLQAD